MTKRENASIEFVKIVLLSEQMESQCRLYCNTVFSDDIYHKIVLYQTRERMFYVFYVGGGGGGKGGWAQNERTVGPVR